MRPHHPHTRRNLLETALGLGCILASTISSSRAASLYWDGVSSTWESTASWSTVAGADTPDPAAVPAATDDAIFNIDTVDAATTVTLNAAQSVNSLVFNNTGTTAIAAAGAARVLTVGAGGLTVDAAAGAVTIGGGTAVTVTLAANQTWHNPTANTVTLLNPVASAGAMGTGAGLTKTGAGNVWFNNTTNTQTINGTLDVQAGKIQYSGDLFVGGLTGTGIVECGGTAIKWFFLNSPLNQTFAGSFQNGAGARSGFVKRGTGTLTLSGTNGTAIDNLAIENGKIILPTGGSIGVGGTNYGSVNVGNTGNVSNNGVLEISGGTLNATRSNNPGFAIGGGNNGRGFVKMTSGALNITDQLKVGNGSATATPAHGGFTLDSGTVISNSWIVVGSNFDRALLTQNGGSITVNTNRMTIAAGNNGSSIGVANLNGGTFNIAAGTNTGIFVGESGAGTLNLMGTTLSLATNGGATSGTVQFGGHTTAIAGNLNLLSGTLSAFGVTKGNSTAGAVFQVNFNGGTLKAATANANFFAALANTEAYVYSGGGTVDNNGVNITIAEPLLAPTGNGVSATGLTVSGGGYLYPPLVTLTGGGGTGATAIASIDGSGNLSGIQITNPGVNYTTAPTFALVGGGAGNTGALSGAATLVANTSGGMTFTGSGTTTLTGANTFTGPIALNAGKLAIGGTHPQAISVASGATLVVEDPFTPQAPLIVPTLTLPSGSIVNLEASGGISEYVEVTTAATGLSFDAISINLYDEGSTNTVTTFGTYTLFKYTGSFTGDEDTDITIANPVLGYIYNFNDTGTEITVTISSSDSDGDDLPNAWEIANGLNPNDPNGINGRDGNADGDFATNYEEFIAGTAANDPDDDPLDLDNDGLLDSWEVNHFTNITARDGTGDYDGDLATDLAEFLAATGPKAADPGVAGDWPDADTVPDSMNDAWEVKYFGSITAKDGTVDSDGDGASDLLEFQALSSPTDAAWTPDRSKLIHRWSFNNSLADSVASSAPGPDAHVNSPATIEDPNGVDASSAVTLSATDVLLAGGVRGTSDYVKLGSSLLGGRPVPATIEVWASQVSLQTWSRVFDFGSADTENLYMNWSNGINAGTTRVEFRDYVTSTSDTANKPYTLNAEYHIVFTFEPGKGDFGANRVNYYVAPTVASGLGAQRGTFSTVNNLANFTDTVATLGRSFYANDNTANARYNDVRVWLGNLPESQREKLHDVGADSVDLTDTDGDGLLDAWETTWFGNATAGVATGDPDGDGFDNLAEQGGRSIPTLPGGLASTPADRDGDQLADDWEATHFASLDQTGSGDPDGDLAANEDEESAGTNPNNAASWPDTDGDLIKDSWEVQYFGDLDIDNDANNANDGAADFDADGSTDKQEFDAGTNPVLASSRPPAIVIMPATGTDAASDISSSKTYTHALDFGATTAAVAVNGVGFHQASVPALGNDGTNNDRWDSIDNTGGRSGPFRMDKSVANDWPQANNNPDNVGSDGNMAVILTDFSHINGGVVGSTQTITLSGLTAGTRYSTRLYYRTWSLAGTRSTTLTFNGDGSNVVTTFNPDQAATPESGYVKFDFTANDSDLTISFGMNVAGASWHQYALTNEVVPAGDGDGDGLPDAWENSYFGNTTSQDEDGDPDSDGTENRAEYLLGLSPVNGSQAFKATQSNVVPGTGVTLTWPAQDGLTFTVWRSTTLGAWTQLGGTVTASGTTGTYTDTTAPLGKAFYKVILTTP